MSHEMRSRAVRIEGLDLRLTGVEPPVARMVAAALPAAVAAEIGGGGMPAGSGLTLASGGPGELTRALAREIAARIRHEIDTGEER